MGENESVWRRNSAKLSLLAFGILLLLIYLLILPAKHDPHWYKHIDIPEVKAHHTPAKRGTVRETDVFLQNGNVVHVEKPVEEEVINTRRDIQQHPDSKEEVKEKKKFVLREGIDFFADYDISAINLTDVEIPPGKRRLFSYVDPATSKWSVTYLSNAPRVFFVPDFLTDKECEDIKNAAKPQLFRSQVSPFLNSKDKNTVNEVRTSSQAWLSATGNPAGPIVQRILALTGFPKGAHEELQVLKYEIGQKYDAHNDYFDPKLYGAQSTNRAVTIFLYLEDVEEGGHTWFPRADGKPVTYDFKSCKQGLGLKPTKRSIAVFYDMKPNGEYDDTSLHGGCPVKKGTKWGGTLWLRVPTS